MGEDHLRRGPPHLNRGSDITRRSTAAASDDALMMREPLDFLDSAITVTRLPPSSAQQTVQASQTPPLTPQPLPPSPPPPGSSSTSASCPWKDCLCCWAPRRWRRCRRTSSAIQLASAGSTTNSSSPYRRLYTRLQSSNIYVYITHVTSSLQGGSSSQGRQINTHTSNKKPSPLHEYESKLRQARWAARSVCSFYNLSTFLALCSLTWATVVLLGAFVSNLRFVDYAMVTSLLLLEAIRLASAAFFTILLTHGLARRSQDPKNIIHGKDDHYRRALAARIVSSFLQAILILPSFICPIIRFPNIEYKDDNLQLSLFIFYFLIISNATVSSFTLICSSASFIYLRDRYDQSILRFYDELTQRGISFGVIRADDFGFFQFAYRMLGSEYARIVQPEAVVKNHRKLIEYLYRHRLGQDFLPIFMDEDDAFVQQAAVNMAGFWADPSKNVGLKEVKLSKKVLSKMADKVGAGQVGWAATNSFGGVARMDPSILAETKTSSGMPLLDRIAELVDGKSSGSLIYVRTLALFYHYSYQKGKAVPVVWKKRELIGKLKQLLEGARVQRARLFAAYLLHLMEHLDASCYDWVAAIRPRTDSYWFQAEVDLFKFVRKQCQLPELSPDLESDIPRDFIRRDDNVCADGSKFL